jgi:deoxycytidine triphosphate deaminase
MHHHHIAPLVAVWVSIFSSLAGAGFAIFAAVWSAKHRGPRAFDAVASARRIRAMPIRARDPAPGSRN